MTNLLNQAGGARRWTKSVQQIFNLLPFYIMSISIVGSMLWFLPQNYREQGSALIVSKDVVPEKVLETLKNINNSDQARLTLEQKKQLAENPLDRLALLNLSVLYGLSGNVAKSNGLALRAADRSFRDLSAQSAAINLSLGQKNFDDAVFRIDGLLRSRPEFSSIYFELLLKITTVPEGLAATTKMLSGNPPWRDKFIKNSVKDKERSAVIYSIFAGLREANAEVSNSELRAYLTELFDNKNYETAYFVWLDFLSPSELLKVGLVYDGGFDMPWRNLNYGWNVIPAANSDMTVGAQNGTASDLVLKLNFQASQISSVNVYQYLRLEPGNYHLSVEMSAERVQSTGGLMWQTRCIESGAFTGQGSTILNATPRTNYEFDFRVDETQCATQQLMLLSASRAALDQVFTGFLVFDNFKISKIE